jgi:polysaccharide biosynthesis protein VpsQ
MIWLAAVFFVFLFFVVVLADVGHLPGMLRAIYAFPGGDKVGHFLLMGGLSFFVNTSFASRLVIERLNGHLVASAVVVLLVTAEELSQICFKNRTFSLDDLAAGYLGIICFGFLAYRMRNRRLAGAALETDSENRSTKKGRPLQ